MARTVGVKRKARWIIGAIFCIMAAIFLGKKCIWDYRGNSFDFTSNRIYVYDLYTSSKQPRKLVGTIVDTKEIQKMVGMIKNWSFADEPMTALNQKCDVEIVFNEHTTLFMMSDYRRGMVKYGDKKTNIVFIPNRFYQYVRNNFPIQ